MEHNFDDQKIEDFLRGQLDSAQSAELEALMASDANFAKRVTLHRDVLQGIDLLGWKELSATIQQVENELENEGLFLTQDAIEHFLNAANPQALKEYSIIKTLIENDPQFSKGVELHDDVQKGIDHFGMKNLRNTINSVTNELEQEGFFNENSTPNNTKQKRTGNIRSLYGWSISVAAVLVIAVFGIYTFLFSEPSTSALFAEGLPEKVETQTVLPQVQLKLTESGFGGITKEQLGYFETGLKAYDQKNFVSAVKALEKYLKADPSVLYLENEAHYYLALSYLYLEQPDFEKAKIHLSAISTTAAISNVDWYEALIDLGQGANNQATNKLKNICNQPTHTYTTKACDLLKKL